MAIVNKFNVNRKQVTLDADIIENMSANDVSYNDSLQYSKNTVGDKLSELEKEVIYDVTANNNRATFASLSALLSSDNLSTLIPTSVRHGGMSIRFVQSSDNKYIQYRLTASGFSTDIHNWTSEDPYFIDKIMQEVNKAIDENIPIEITGDVTNAPDEEDLTSVNVGGTDVLKFKDKTYNPLTYSGLGRNYLRKNMVNGVNTLTQSMMQDTNTIYVIQYDFTLGEDITIPANCVLQFDGGSISANQNLSIKFTETYLKGNIKILSSVSGRIKNTDIIVEWFGIIGDGITDNYQSFQKLLGLNLKNKRLNFDTKYYYISQTIVFEQGLISFIGKSNGNLQTRIVTNNNITLFWLKGSKYILEGISFFGNTNNTYNTDGNSIGIYLCGTDNPSTETDGTKVSLDSTIINCSFQRLNKGIYAIGNQVVIEKCFFSVVFNGIVIDCLKNENITPVYLGSTGRSYTIQSCACHSMNYLQSFVNVISRKCLGVFIKDARVDCNTVLFKGSLVNGLIQGCSITGSNSSIIKATVIENSIISGNQFILNYHTGWKSNTNQGVPRDESAINAISIYNTMIVDNYFGESSVSQIEMGDFSNVTISANVFMYWGKTSIEDNDIYAAIVITSKDRGIGLIVNGNVFSQDYSDNEPILSYILAYPYYKIRSIIICNNFFYGKNNSEMGIEWYYAGTTGNHALVSNNKVDYQSNTGTVANKPSRGLYIGCEFFATDINNGNGGYIYWNGTTWVDATGTPV